MSIESEQLHNDRARHLVSQIVAIHCSTVQRLGQWIHFAQAIVAKGIATCISIRRSSVQVEVCGSGVSARPKKEPGIGFPAPLYPKRDHVPSDFGKTEKRRRDWHAKSLRWLYLGGRIFF
jgi:hypothetical protein